MYRICLDDYRCDTMLNVDYISKFNLDNINVVGDDLLPVCESIRELIDIKHNLAHRKLFTK